MSIRLTLNPMEANAVTHGGNFHADDIFSTILLEKIFDDVVLFRIQDEEPDKISFAPNVTVFDVGFGEFDHHQKKGNGTHPSSDNTRKPIPYASFGLLWKKYGHKICSEMTNKDSFLTNQLWNQIEQTLVIGVDSIDNGIHPSYEDNYKNIRMITFSSIIALMNPCRNEKEENAFEKAVDLARNIFDTVAYNLLYKLNYPESSYELNPKFFRAEQILTCILLNRLHPEVDWNIQNIASQIKQIPGYYDKFDNNFSLLGNVWNTFGKEYCAKFTTDNEDAEYVWRTVSRSVVSGIAHPELITHNNPYFVDYDILTLSKYVESLNPMDYSEEAYQKALQAAFDIVELVFDRITKDTLERLYSRECVEREINISLLPHRNMYKESSKHILIFDEHIHWKEWISKFPLARNIWFVISPSNKGGYIIQPVPCKYNHNGWRKGFPKKWHGLNGKVLRKVTGVPTALFVHPAQGFIAGASDLEGAVNLAKKAFSNSECVRIGQ